MVAAQKEPSQSSAVKSGAANSTWSSAIVFEISAMNRPTIDVVKNALRQKAEQMIETVPVSYHELEQLTEQNESELKSLQCSGVSVEIGKPVLKLCLLYILQL